jgi:hypothetical protein
VAEGHGHPLVTIKVSRKMVIMVHGTCGQRRAVLKEGWGESDQQPFLFWKDFEILSEWLLQIQF